MAAVTICSDLGAQENKVCHCFHCFPIFCHEVMGPDVTILVYWILSFKPTFSLSSLTFIKRLVSSSAFCHKGGVICVSDISPGNLYSSLCFIQPGIYAWCTLHISEIIRVTIYSFDVLLSLFGFLLFHSKSSLYIPIIRGCVKAFYFMLIYM